jgi:DNA-binding Lrp family transcriptional regulator
MTLAIKAVPSNVEQVIAFLKKIDEADFCFEAVGSYNIIMMLFLKNIDDAQKIIESIKKQPYVIQVKTSIWTHIEKALIRPQNINLVKIIGADL